MEPGAIEARRVRADVGREPRQLGTAGGQEDPALSLDRLARSMGLPARTVSAAINRARGQNVSQYVNAHRIADACRLLDETQAPITRILFDVGFQTKSNFNREFLRIQGVSPSAWRARVQRDA